MCIFFVKQKQAYEMRISGWSSDVCSSDLAPIGSPGWRVAGEFHDNFAEQVGWPELVAQVAAVHHALPEVERPRTAIYANNYGEAGATNRHGPAYGLPPAPKIGRASGRGRVCQYA